jgi:peptidase S24-like protein
MNAATVLESLSAAELDAVARLWKRERRKLVSSFNGTSMLPAIAPGQQVIVECGVEPAVGDVAVFLFRDQVGVHRVVARSANWLLTWGDANPLPDDPIEPVRVVGTIRNAPAAKRSVRRALLIRSLGARSISIDLLARRVRLLHRMRAAWAQGPLRFMRKGARAVFRGNSHC